MRSTLALMYADICIGHLWTILNGHTVFGPASALLKSITKQKCVVREHQLLFIKKSAKKTRLNCNNAIYLRIFEIKNRFVDASRAGKDEFLQTFGGAGAAGVEFPEKDRRGRRAENGRNDAARRRFRPGRIRLWRKNYGGQAGFFADYSQRNRLEQCSASICGTESKDLSY